MAMSEDASSEADASFDPAWWNDVYESIGPASQYELVEHVTVHLAAAAREAADSAGEQSLRARVLSLLARAASPMLQAEDWNEPFRPAWALTDGRRSPLPQDLDADDLALLTELAPHLSPAPLRARAADIAWTFGDRSNHDLLAVALDSYLDVPINTDTWYDAGGVGYRRALELARRRGAAGAAVVARLTAALRGFVLSSSVSDLGLVADAAELLRLTGKPSGDDAAEVAAHLWALTEASPPALGRELLREIAAWQRGYDTEQVHRAVETIAELYVVEAEGRLAGDGSAMAASMLVERAVATLRGLPRKYRTARGIEPWLRELRRELVDVREETLEEMNVISSDPLDVNKFVVAARRSVAGLDALEALVRLCAIAPLINLRAALEEQRGQTANLFSRMLGNVTFAGDGRKIGQHDGISGVSVSDEQALREVVRDFHNRVQLNVQVVIHPALQVLTGEHRYDLALLARLCRESPLVPRGHEELWARGLQHGLSGDFPSAVSVLVPQIEQLLRRHLKLVGVDTLYVADDGTEKEKTLGSLLEVPETIHVLGENWVFELKTLLSEQLGLNVRNDLAHGLLTDGGAWSASAVYAWWHGLRLVVIPHHVATTDGEEAPAPGD